MASVLKVDSIQDTSGTGNVLMPSRPCFFAYFASGSEWNISSSNSDKTPLNATYVNQGNCWSTTNYLFTAPVAGVYQINWGFSVGVDGDSASYFASRVYKNGSLFGGIHRNYNPPSQGGNQYGGHDTATLLSFAEDETFYVIPQPSTTLTIKQEMGTYMSGL